MYYDIDSEPCDLMTWAKTYEHRHLAKDEAGVFTVMTIFLGIDQSFGDDLEPAIFETKVFKTEEIGTSECEGLDCWQYNSLTEAMAGHKAMVTKWS